MTRQANLTNRTSRLKLKPLTRHHAKIGADLFLDYRRPGAGPGTWSEESYIDGKYRLKSLTAVADDMEDADGVRILTYAQACDRARELAKEHVERERLKADGPPLTVGRVCESYADWRESRWTGELSGSKHDARRRLARLPKALLDTPLAPLTADTLATTCSGVDRRTLHDLGAALRRAAKQHRDKLPPTLENAIKDGLAGLRGAPKVVREIVALSDSDARRLVLASKEIDEEGQWDGSLFRIVLTLASTGSRFSQIARCTVADVQVREKRLMIPTSRKGQSANKAARTAVPIGEDVIKALAIAGRLGNEPLFMRPGWKQAGVGQWQKAEIRPWRSSAEFARPWRLIVERAGLPATVPYDLRHAAIIRALRLGLPVQLVARLFDTSATMIQKNYSASIVDALGELSERMVISLSPATVTPIARAV
jgi:integrase